MTAARRHAKATGRAAVNDRATALAKAAALEAEAGIDWTRLSNMRAAHAELRSRYLSVVKQVRASAVDVAAHREAALPALPNKAAAAFVGQPLDALQALTPVEIATAGHDARAVRRLITALQNARRLQIEATDLAARAGRAAALLSTLNDFVRRFE